MDFSIAVHAFYARPVACLLAKILSEAERILNVTERHLKTIPI